MKIRTVLTPAEITLLSAEDLTASTAVVFDVLRATSTMTTALAHGVLAIYPAADIEEALTLKQLHPEALLGGERHGEKIAGFDLGNSPLEVRDLAGKEIISTTTNGTVALRAVAGAGEVIAGSLLNIAALAEFLTSSKTENLLLICAGTGKDFAIEDALAAGALVATLQTHCEVFPDDAARMLVHLWQKSHHDISSVLANSKNGRRLIQRGRAAEVEWCARLDACRTVGVLANGALRGR